MKKVYIAGNYTDKFTASSKAKIDAEDILEKNGFKNIGFKRSHYPVGPKSYLRLALNMLRLLFTMPRNGVIVLQQPINHNKQLMQIAKARGNKVIVLVHDLNSLRDWNDSGEKEILNSSDAVIVHTAAMKKWLEEHKIGKNYVILEIFDYLHGGKVPGISGDHKMELAFAGNLGKSKFLDHIKLNNAGLNLYGIGIEKRTLNNGTVFKGCFPPDQLAENMEADFGLVWDGDSADNCSGLLGDYLRLIAPHKLSMYLSAGLPVIVWKESAMAPFVIDNGVGFAVDSLSEADILIGNLSNEEYAKMKKNVDIVGQKLGEGNYLSKALDSALDWI